ncbi:MAG: LytTR family transcriptional regulator, partial [Ferruginibacter sp.]|nr:LytTR family transcriptional regulator [Ferruginibacter sp.]
DGVFLKKKTMQYYEDNLPAQEFIRVHRSYIINTQLITRIDLHEKDSHLVLLTTGVRLPVSKAGYVKLKMVLGI